MNFFKSQGPSPEEISKENRVKKGITSELSRSLKALQQQHIKSSEPIYSEDSANAVCNVLEAAFLHGLKSSFTSKISSYLVAADPDNLPVLGFWSFLVKFTHKDVLSQLNHLGQITTEIGLCRAWIRVAINDCLMESYIDAMLADTESLRSFYTRLAFLRDEEQAGILKTYLQSLSHFTFELSHNSSVLNIWTSTPLILSGIWEPNSNYSAMVSSRSEPAISAKSLPAAKPGPSSPEKIANLVSSSATAVKKTKKSKPRTGSDPKRIPQSVSCHAKMVDISSAQIPDTPPNTPLTAAMNLTKSDIDEIRKLTLSHGARAGSDSSTNTSQVSCPDPMDTRNETNNRMRKDILEEEKFPVKSTTENKMNSEPKDIGEPDVSPYDTGFKISPTNVKTFEREDLGMLPEEIDRQPVRPILTRRKSDIVEPTLSSAVAMASTPPVEPDVARSRIRDVQAFVTDSLRLRTETDVLSDILAENPQEVTEAKEEHDCLDNNHQGNNLGMMTGWSSQFEQQESFKALLENYLPERNVSSTRISDVIEDLPEQGTGRTVRPQEFQPSRIDVDLDDFDIVSVAESTGILHSDIPPPTGEDNNSTEGDFEVLSNNTPIYSASLDSRTQGMLNIYGEICNEKGLDVQNYQCKGCSRPVGMIYGKARVCSYDGCYYCYECHENDEYYIPSKIVHNWDFRKHKVSRHNKSFLQEVEDEPLLDIHELNPRLYEHVNEMNDVKMLRQQLRYLKTYLFTCKQSVADDLRKQTWPKEYLYDNIHLYSSADLLQVNAGQMAPNIKKIIKNASKHVYDCRLCSQKGFVCEICNNPKVIYPFEIETTVRCHRCKAVYHKDCRTDLKPCPKCERRQLRQGKLGNNITTPDSMDYGYLPTLT